MEYSIIVGFIVLGIGIMSLRKSRNDVQAIIWIILGIMMMIAGFKT